jgi:hypothetical protein
VLAVATAVDRDLVDVGGGAVEDELLVDELGRAKDEGDHGR